MGKMERLLARLDHAWEQRQVGYAEAHAFLDTNPYRIWHELDPDTGDYLVCIEPTGPVPPRLGFLAGDCINNIRSCLDNMVSALPGANVKNSAFVILDTDPATEAKPTTFAKKATRLKGIPDAARDIIESLQPYKRTQNASRVNVPIGTLLLRLEQLWNADKHRSPTLALSAVRGTRVIIDTPLLVPVEQNLGAFDGRHVAFRLRPMGDISDVEAHVKGEISLDIGLGEGPFSGDRLDLTITDLYECVRYDVLPLFSQWL